MKHPNQLVSHLIAVFGAFLIFAGCTAQQKASATKVVLATTQPTQAIHDQAANIAAQTVGTPVGDVAHMIEAATGIALVLERLIAQGINLLPTKKDSVVAASISTPRGVI